MDGVKLARQAQLTIRTAMPTQDIAHLRRLVSEHLDRTPLAAPVNHLRLRTLDTAPWGGVMTSLLPEEQVKGEPLHALIERLGARLGPDQVLMPLPQADHRPECMQQWVPAHTRLGLSRRALAEVDPVAADAALYPTWLLREPLALQMQDGKPVFQGPLRLMPRPQRLDGVGWWDLAAPKPAVRDYYLAISDTVGLLWLYCEQPRHGEKNPRWFLQGVYA
jgi:protein ImuB